MKCLAFTFTFSKCIFFKLKIPKVKKNIETKEIKILAKRVIIVKNDEWKIKKKDGSYFRLKKKMAIILRYQTWLELFCILKTIKDALKIPTMSEKKIEKIWSQIFLKENKLLLSEILFYFCLMLIKQATFSFCNCKKWENGFNVLNFIISVHVKFIFL